MGTLFKLAWRNVWRNKRRTAITLASISFGLTALLLMQSLIKSIQDQLVEKATRAYSAHLQIQSEKTTDPKVPDFRVEQPRSVFEAVSKDPEVKAWAPKVIFTGLVSSALTSKGTLVVGVDPEKEKNLTIMSSYLTEGRYLSSESDREVYLGVKLARELDVRLGEKLVLMVQGADGSLSAEAFRVCGLFKSGSVVYDGQMVFVPIAASQRLLVCGEEVSAVSLNLKNIDEIDAVQKRLAQALQGQPVKVLTWRESASEIVSIQQFQNAILLLMLFIIFTIVALGIFNTLLMSLFERIREFGIMMALGAQPSHIVAVILAEAALLGVIGVALGTAAGTALILYFGERGIPLPIGDALGYWMPFDRVIYLHFAWKKMILSSAAALFTSLAAALFPAVHAARIRPADALRHY
jgi:ABC-type lipoprotein release transport system permease subunit